MEISSLDDEPIFTINGKSILSNKTYSLIESIDELKGYEGRRATRLAAVYGHRRDRNDIQ